MKKLLFLFIALLAMPVFAANTHTADLESGDPDFYSRAVASGDALNITGDFTLMAWLNFETLPSNKAGTCIWGGLTGSLNNGIWWRVLEDSNKLRVYYDGGGKQTYYTTNAAVVGSTGTWVHLASACDVSAKTCKNFVNGSEVASGAVQDATSVGSAAYTLYIGMLYNGDPREYIDGYIDDLRVYTTYRAEADIAADYDCELTGTEADYGSLIAWWKLDNNANDTIGGNTLTPVGSPVYQSGSLPFTDACGGGAAAEPSFKKKNGFKNSIY